MAEQLPVLCSGFLHKKGGSALSGDKRRWFELREGVLEYFTSRGGARKGGIPISAHTRAVAAAKAAAFRVTGPHCDREYELQAENGRDRDRWVEAVNSAAESVATRRVPVESDVAAAAAAEEDEFGLGMSGSWSPEPEPLRRAQTRPRPRSAAEAFALPFDTVLDSYPGFADRMEQLDPAVLGRWRENWAEGAESGLEDAVAALLEEGVFGEAEAEPVLSTEPAEVEEVAGPVAAAAEGTPQQPELESDDPKEVSIVIGDIGRSENADAQPLLRPQETAASPCGGAESPLLDADGVQLHEASLTPQQMAIVALNDPDGVWEMDAAAAEQVFKLIDADGSGELTLDELQAACESEAVRSFLLNCNQPVLRGLLDPDLLSNAFKTLDTDGSGTISASEWSVFIDEVATKRLAFLEGKAHLTGQCYWGFGSALSGERAKDPCGLVSRGKLTRGWADDYWYFIRNNHPLFALFCVDPDHPLSRTERLALEFVTQGFSFMMSGMHDWVDHDDPDQPAVWRFLWEPQVFPIVFVTIPGMILFKILVTLYTCPMKTCWVDETAATPAEIKRMHSCHKWGHRTSLLFIAASLFFYGLGLYMYFFSDDPVEIGRLQMWIQGRAQGYVLWFLTTFFMAYCPFAAFSCGPISFGVWELQRRKVCNLLTPWDCLPDHDLLPDQTKHTMKIRSRTAGDWTADAGTPSPFDEDIRAAKLKCLEKDFQAFVVDGSEEAGGTATFKRWGQDEGKSFVRVSAAPCEGRTIHHILEKREDTAM